MAVLASATSQLACVSLTVDCPLQLADFAEIVTNYNKNI